MLIVKVPAINGLGKTPGCEKAPDAISKALKKHEKGIEFDSISINKDNLEETNKNILNKAKEIFNREDRVIFLGGDHSISYPLVRAFDSCFNNAGLIIFDAHADCMPAMKEPTHEEWLRALIEKGFNPKSIILIGARRTEKEEKEFLESKHINIFSMKELLTLEETTGIITEEARKFNSLYISIDIDVVDPAFAPAVAFPEPGGISSKELLYMLQRLALLKNLKAVDLVEINPEKDDGLTVSLAAKIIAGFL